MTALAPASKHGPWRHLLSADHLWPLRLWWERKGRANRSRRFIPPSFRRPVVLGPSCQLPGVHDGAAGVSGALPGRGPSHLLAPGPRPFFEGIWGGAGPPSPWAMECLLVPSFQGRWQQLQRMLLMPSGSVNSLCIISLFSQAPIGSTMNLHVKFQNRNGKR